MVNLMTLLLRICKCRSEWLVQFLIDPEESGVKLRNCGKKSGGKQLI